MRAAASSDSPRARNRQSQRVTRRSLVLPPGPAPAFTVFHPVPSHSGQTSAGALIAWDPCVFTASIFTASIFAPSTLEPIIFKRIPSLSTLHPRGGSAQAGNLACLCTSCERGPWPVEDVGKRSLQYRKAATVAPIRAEGVRNRLPARIFTVDFRHRRRRIQAVRFPNSVIASFSRCRLSTKETCEERL